MNISLVGVTLHVADVERSLNFYKRIPDSSILYHMPGTFALLRVGSGRLGLLQDQKRPFHVRTWTQHVLISSRQALRSKVRRHGHGENEMHW
jgi:hypothetical protein